MPALPIDSPSFSGHETFALRFMWLKKGYDAVAKDPEAFTADDALVHLGVGKNMVRSIRHWGLATRMLEEDPGSRGRRILPTGLAESLFGATDPWDPYLEDPATLWIIHWQLASCPGKATTWYWLFNHFPGHEFTPGTVVEALLRLAAENGWAKLTPASLKRDVDCCIRTYNTSRRTARAVLEDSLDCPLSELGLIRAGPDRDTYLLTREVRPTLPLPVFAYGLAEYVAARDSSGSAIALDELMHHPGAPGRVFRLNEDALLMYVEDVEDVTAGAATFDETAGLKQVRIRSVLDPMAYLRSYYSPPKRRRRRAS